MSKKLLDAYTTLDTLLYYMTTWFLLHTCPH